jgi:uncharacterized integral membrane protein
MKAKIFILMILIIFLTIFISQNSSDFPINVLFWSFQIPGIIMILLTGLLGIVIGFILALIIMKPSEKKIVPEKEITKPEENKQDV